MQDQSSAVFVLFCSLFYSYFCLFVLLLCFRCFVFLKTKQQSRSIEYRQPGPSLIQIDPTPPPHPLSIPYQSRSQIWITGRRISSLVAQVQRAVTRGDIKYKCRIFYTIFIAVYERSIHIKDETFASLTRNNKISLLQ